MADHTKIEWTDSTWNPITGCSVVSPGCTNCYAMRLAGTRMKNHPSRAALTSESRAGPVWNGNVRFNETWLDQPLKWKRPRRIFVCAHGDLFHEAVPDAWIDKVFAVMALCPRHSFQVLTKRAGRMRDYMASDRRDQINADAGTLMHWDDMPTTAWPLPNVWLGVSVEDQARADERIPALLATPAAVRWISAEPLLGPVDINDYLHDSDCLLFEDDAICTCGEPLEVRVDWVVAGGESGPGARPMHPDWARSLRDQCAAAEVAFLFKQWGGWVHARDTLAEVPMDRHRWLGNDGTLLAPCDESYRRMVREEDEGDPRHFKLMLQIGKKQAGRMLDGRLHDGFPKGVAYG